MKYFNCHQQWVDKEWCYLMLITLWVKLIKKKKQKIWDLFDNKFMFILYWICCFFSLYFLLSKQVIDRKKREKEATWVLRCSWMPQEYLHTALEAANSNPL